MKRDVYNLYLQKDVRPRVLAYGSSNTQRLYSGLHWFDCYELAMYQTYDSVPRCINSGVGGDTAAKLIHRFDQEAALFQPHLVIITIGGNDSNPINNITPEMFRHDLMEVYRRFIEMDCEVVFQTYYAPDPEQTWPLDVFYRDMDIVREVAQETQSGLIDQLALWEPFRKELPEQYALLKTDGFHINRFGNMIMGLEIADYFNLQLGTDDPDYWNFPRALYKQMKSIVE